MGPFIRSCFCSECGRWRTFAGFANALPGQEPVGNLPVDAEGADWGAASGRLAALRRMPPCVLWKPSFFAPALIAPKPVKPCDGGVFGALNLLSKTERQPSQTLPDLPRLGGGVAWALRRWCSGAGVAARESVQLLFVGAGCGTSAALGAEADSAWAIPGVAHSLRGARRVCALPPALISSRWFVGGQGLKTAAQASFFAPALIAPKPVKPCDGGVLGAFYLLLVSEQADGKACKVQSKPNPA